MPAVFLTLGATVGTWASRVPAIKGSLHLSAGTLGLALLGPALGTVAAMPLTGALLATVAPRRLARAGLVLVAALLPLTALATSSGVAAVGYTVFSLARTTGRLLGDRLAELLEPEVMGPPIVIRAGCLP